MTRTLNDLSPSEKTVLASTTARVWETTEALVLEHGHESVAMVLIAARDRAQGAAKRFKNDGLTDREADMQAAASMLEALSRAFCPGMWRS